MKVQQRKLRATRNAAAVAFAFAVLGALPSCDAEMPTDVTPSVVETTMDVGPAERSESEGEGCIVINEKIYCF